MPNDDTFRIALLACGVLFFPIGLYHRFRADSGEPIDRWQEGVVILFGLRLTALVVFASGLAWMIYPPSMAWASLPLPLWLRWTGVAIVVLAGLLIVWTFHNLGKNLTDTVVTRKEHTLVFSGPYHWVRHPFYVAGALGVLGSGLAMANGFFLIGGAIVMGFLVARTPIEEGKLVARFGDDYRAYMQRVGRFWPRW